MNITKLIRALDEQNIDTDKFETYLHIKKTDLRRILRRHKISEEWKMIGFKSKNKYFEDERLGLKNWTIREIDIKDMRFLSLLDMMKTKRSKLATGVF